MSGLAGIWYRDRTPVDPAALPRMLDNLAHPGPAGCGTWQHNELAIGSVSARVLPEARDAPIVDGAGRVFAFDGRIDNREELAEALAAAGDPPRSTSDDEIAFRACVVWGEEAPARLLGDFAFVLWDAPACRLLCARDIHGIRPLCYRLDGARFACASRLHALVTPPFDQPAPNEALVAEHLTGILTTTSETLFSGVYRLPPATVLIATPDAIRLREYWKIDPRAEIRYATEREYDDHYRSLLRAAVACRLRATTDIGILLSGGLDSSAVTATAVTLLGGSERIHSYSLSWPGDASDERPFVEAVAAKWRFGDRVTILSDPEVNPYETDVRRYRDLPSYPNGARSEALFEVAGRQGVRLMLTGLGGDEWFTGHQAHYADSIAAGHPFRALRDMRRDIQTKAMDGWRSALWNAVRPLTPSWALAAGRRLIGHTVVPDWIRPGFAARVSLADRLYSMPRRFGFPTHAQNEMFREAAGPSSAHALEMLERTVSGFGLEAAHPLEDRRLVEFGFALPEVQRWRDGQPKAIVRRAAAPLLPIVVTDRVESPDYGHVLRTALAQVNARARLAGASEIFDTWVDRDRLLAEYDRGVGRRDNQWPFWMATALRLWADAIL